MITGEKRRQQDHKKREGVDDFLAGEGKNPHNQFEEREGGYRRTNDAQEREREAINNNKEEIN